MLCVLIFFFVFSFFQLFIVVRDGLLEIAGSQSRPIKTKTVTNGLYYICLYSVGCSGETGV